LHQTKTVKYIMLAAVMPYLRAYYPGLPFAVYIYFVCLNKLTYSWYKKICVIHLSFKDTIHIAFIHLYDMVGL